MERGSGSGLAERIVEKTGRGVSGWVKPGFEGVREAFIENFEHRHEVGAACCVYHRGEKVVDIWGGMRDRATGEPWEEGTMVVVFSTTKGVSALTIALAHSRGLLDYDERVSTYWPEFARNGKERITVRQLLAHQAGLFELDVPLTAKLLREPEELARVLARQRPAWEPGTRQGYHAITLGFYESELLRRVDPGHRTLGHYFQDEIATPLGLDFYIRLPREIPNARLARLERFTMGDVIGTVFETPLFVLAAINARSRLRRSLLGSELPTGDAEHVYARDLEIPSGGGVGTARAIARLYSVFAAGGRDLALREATLRELMAPAKLPPHGARDACLGVDTRFSLGLSKPGPGNRFGHPSSFGTPGAGGSFGYADPHAQIGYGYVMNRMGAHLIDRRDEALRTAVYAAIGESRKFRG